MPFEYQVIRSERSTTDIIIERDGSLLVRAPRALSRDRIDAILEQKQRWIYQGLAEWRDLNATRVLREFKVGEGFLYLGRSYRLLFDDQLSVPLQLRDGRFRMQRHLVDTGSVEAARAAFQAFYVAKGQERVPPRVQHYAAVLGVQPGHVAVRELGYRWASCAPSGDLAFHWKCLMAPLTIIDYVIVHELCHLLHRDHSAAFWNEVDKVLPDYRERKAWLRQHGASLDI